MGETCGSVAEVARDGDRLGSSNLADFCGGTRRGLTNSRAAVRNRKHGVMERVGEHKLLLLFFLFSPLFSPEGGGINESGEEKVTAGRVKSPRNPERREEEVAREKGEGKQTKPK